MESQIYATGQCKRTQSLHSVSMSVLMESYLKICRRFFCTVFILINAPPPEASPAGHIILVYPYFLPCGQIHHNEEDDIHNHFPFGTCSVRSVMTKLWPRLDCSYKGGQGNGTYCSPFLTPEESKAKACT